MLSHHGKLHLIYPLLQTHEAHAQESQALKTHISKIQGAMDETNMDVVKQLREENARLKNEANHAAQQ